MNIYELSWDRSGPFRNRALGESGSTYRVTREAMLGRVRWSLSVDGHHVEYVPSEQVGKDNASALEAIAYIDKFGSVPMPAPLLLRVRNTLGKETREIDSRLKKSGLSPYECPVFGPLLDRVNRLVASVDFQLRSLNIVPLAVAHTVG